jgi:hypothetical protein
MAFPASAAYIEYDLNRISASYCPSSLCMAKKRYIIARKVESPAYKIENGSSADIKPRNNCHCATSLA